MIFVSLKVNTTISNLRKNLSECDCRLWQVVWVFEVFNTIASSLKKTSALYSLQILLHVVPFRSY